VLAAVLERALDPLDEAIIHPDEPRARPLADRLVAGSASAAFACRYGSFGPGLPSLTNMIAPREEARSLRSPLANYPEAVLLSRAREPALLPPSLMLSPPALAVPSP